MTESPTQEYALPNHQDGIKPEPNVSNQRVLGSELSSKSPAQEHIYPRSQEGQESSVTMGIHQLLNHDHEQTVVSVPRSPTFHPINMASEEYSCSPQSDGSGRESREQSPTAERQDREQPQLRTLNGSSEYSRRESDMIQTWDSAGESSSVDDPKRAGAEVIYPRGQFGAGQPIFDQGSCNKAPGLTSDTLPPLQMTTILLPETSGPYRDQETRLPPTENISLPSMAELGYPPQHNRWGLRPKYQWSGFLPDIYETRRLESPTAHGQAPRLIQGPTQPLGPPLKPFDGARSEEVAREQWARVMRERDIREAKGQ